MNEAMTNETLEDMFVHQLEEIYYIEDRLTAVLGDMAEDVGDEKLRSGFREHQAETQDHVARVETVFQELGLQPSQRESRVLEAMIDERQEFHDETEGQELRDLYDIQAGLKTERMEMTGYQGLIMLANKLEYDDDVIDPLEDNLSSERATFYKLQAFSQGSKLRSMVSQIMG